LPGASYKLLSESLAIRTDAHGKRSTLTIPAGETVTVAEGQTSGRRLVQVECKGEAVMMFSDDLEDSAHSYFSDSRSQTRSASGKSTDSAAQNREQALIEHSMGLSTANEELERFAFVAAHDLKSPLRSINTLSQILLQRNENALDPESLHLLRYISRSAARMDQLIKDLLDFALTSADRDVQELDLSEIVSMASEQLQESIQESKAKIETDFERSRLLANEIELMRLFQNLIGNAIKYCPDKIPEIRSSSFLKNGSLVFCLRDNGIGIDPKHHERIFAPFQRLHGMTEYEGTGVGLAICVRIVEKYGGRIWVESELGRGSAFCFTLPNATK
jgi:light-regulated signal transduction histidine kinase (bacteriophytochrome)